MQINLDEFDLELDDSDDSGIVWDDSGEKDVENTEKDDKHKDVENENNNDNVFPLPTNLYRIGSVIYTNTTTRDLLPSPTQAANFPAADPQIYWRW